MGDSTIAQSNDCKQLITLCAALFYLRFSVLATYLILKHLLVNITLFYLCMFQVLMLF